MSPSATFAKVVGSVAIGGLAASFVVTAAFAVSHPSEQTFRQTSAVEVPAGVPPTTPTTTVATAPVETDPASPAVVVVVPVETVPSVVLEAAPVTTTTTTAPPVETPPLAKPGHYACTGDDNATADCTSDETGVDVTPNHGDDPATAVDDPATAARLEVEYCAVKPWTCP